jgi:hypothetical protein
MQQTLLTRMENLLNEDGTNYTAFLRSYSTDVVTNQSIQEIVRCMIGDEAVIDNVQEVDFSEVELELRESIGYLGDESAGPGVAALETPEFLTLLEVICEDAKAQSLRSTSLCTFRFKNGHPAYPVFWDFAFLFVGASKCELLVGSSSD